MWVAITVKTTDKISRSVVRRRWGFRASTAGVLLGKNSMCGISLPDPNLSDCHARIFLNADGQVAFEPISRVYLLIGQGDRSNGPVALERGQVVKLGACSLEVSEAVATAAEHAARMKARSGAASGAASGSSKAAVGAAGIINAASGAGAQADGTSGMSGASARNRSSHASRASRASADADGDGDEADGDGTVRDSPPEEEEEDEPPVPEAQWREARSDRVCYICLEGEDEDDDSAGGSSAHPHEKPPPLFPSPCIW